MLLLVTVVLVLAAGASPAPQALSIVPALRGFSQPVLLTYAPGESGALYVVEQGGRIYRVAKGRADGIPRRRAG